MEISKSSWHYRLLSFFGMDIPTSLCPYFWKTVFVCIISLFACVVVSAVAWAVLYLGGLIWLFPNLPNGMDPVSFTFTLTASQHFDVIWRSFVVDICFIFTVMCVLYILAKDFRKFVHGSVYNSKLMKDRRKHEDYDDYIWDKKDRKRSRKNYKEEHPGLVKSFYKAHKDKVCPFLTFKD